MAIPDIKKGLLGGGMRERPEKKLRKTPAPIREAKKDASIFGGSSYMDRGDFMHRLKSSELYRGTDLGEKDRSRLGEKLFGRSSLVKKEDVEKAEKQLNLGKWGKFKDLSHEDKEKAKRLTKRILGK